MAVEGDVLVVRAALVAATFTPLEELALLTEKRGLLDDAQRDVLQKAAATTGAQWKFADACLVVGESYDAALGLNVKLGISLKRMWAGLGLGLDEIKHEVETHGSATDKECLDYILRGTAGSSDRAYEHSGGRSMDRFDDDADTDGRAGRGLDYFVSHPNSRHAALETEHVVAMRLYTSAAYRSITTPFRREGAHPWPITCSWLQDGIKRLRAVGTLAKDHAQPMDLWSGRQNIKVDDAFFEVGGCHHAPLSSSSDLRVAVANYTSGAEQRLLLKLKTRDAMERGADVKYLSVFPGESEYLYPPMTYFKATGRAEFGIEAAHGVSYDVIELQPIFGS